MKATFESLIADPAVSSNPTMLLMAANIFALERNWPEALKCCAAAFSLELCAQRRPPNPLSFPSSLVSPLAPLCRPG